MNSSLVVLTDFSAAAERARRYAATLAAALPAELHLVHVYSPEPVPLDFGLTLPVPDTQYRQRTSQRLDQLAAALPVPATAEVFDTSWDLAVSQAVEKYRPQLLVAGLTTTDGLLDDWLSNRVLAVPQRVDCPVLLVPEHLPASGLRPPRQLALALEDRPFRLTPGATALAPLLDALGPDIVAVTVLDAHERAGGWDGLRAAQTSGLAAAMPRCGLHKVLGQQAGSGILQGVDELEADVLALLDQGHGWLHKLFTGSVTGYVARHTPVPLLLLPAQRADTPA
ncbi:universal stress protein [Hymenobacter aquaticus]|uniref:Universal stress protein n=1 Tax=Hymenobacter aquaticus TaxID=1867101 RepID=A0A4Z0Q331_9BACT|nr:universal stress protein [Hymenobacter aquaticus]TGE23886.1 universal stress protein [Hymenobacter aquaticus]